MLPLITNSLKKIERPQKLGEVKAKNDKKTGYSILFKTVSRKNGLTDFGQRVFSHSQCTVVSKKEIKIGGH